MRVDILKKGEVEISEEEFAKAEPMKNVHVMELFFPIGHIEAGFVRLPTWTRRVVLNFKTPFKLPPIVQLIWEGFRRGSVSEEKAVIEYMYYYRGYMPYVVVGLDVERDASWSFEEAIKGLADDATFKAAVAAALGMFGGGGLGAGLSKLVE